MSQEAEAAVSVRSVETDDRVLAYLHKHGLRLHPAQKKLIELTKGHPRGFMLGSADELQLLANLTRIIKAKKTIELGVFTGYSALTIALALPSDGRLLACDITDQFVKIGQPVWKEADVEGKIQLRIAPALTTLQELTNEGEAGTFDFAFIDADKENLCNYYELCYELVRPGGIIAIDNTLWCGKVPDPDNHEPWTEAVRYFNRRLSEDTRVDISMLGVGDGTTIVFKKHSD